MTVILENLLKISSTIKSQCFKLRLSCYLNPPSAIRISTSFSFGIKNKLCTAYFSAFLRIKVSTKKYCSHGTPLYLALKFLIWILANNIKICNKHSFTLTHILTSTLFPCPLTLQRIFLLGCKCRYRSIVPFVFRAK